jgi:Amt family ammonium transporter
MLLTAVFAAGVGLVEGETTTFLYHLLALVITALFTFGGSLLIYKVVDMILPMRVREDQEVRGLDLSQHGEHIFY